jgi:hypothetical protein
MRDVLPAPLPLCAKCGKPVTSASRSENPFKDTIVFKGYCHGDVHRIEVTRQEMFDDPGRQIVFFEEAAKP